MRRVQAARGASSIHVRHTAPLFTYPRRLRDVTKKSAGGVLQLVLTLLYGGTGKLAVMGRPVLHVTCTCVLREVTHGGSRCRNREN